MRRLFLVLSSIVLLSVTGSWGVGAVDFGPKWKPSSVPSFKQTVDQEGIKKAYWYSVAKKLEQMLIEKLSQQNCCIDTDSNAANPKKVKGSVYYIAWDFEKHKPKLAYSTDECTKVEGGKFLNEFTCKNFSCTQTSFENAKVFDNALCGENEKCIKGACVSSECNDSDNGANYGFKGEVTEYNDNGTIKEGPIADTCLSSSMLAEGICKKKGDGKLELGVVYNNCCAAGMECSEGKCVVPAIGDIDGDGLVGKCDNCPGQANPGQEDKDGDGAGDLCDDFKEPDVSDVGEGRYPSISADGRYVAFVSYSDNLVPNDANDKGDIFVRDLKEGITERVSVSSNGVEANGWSGNPSISGDGRIVAFESDATNLVSGDTNGERDIFIHDTKNGTTERVSVSNIGGNAEDNSYDPHISANGRYVAFWSFANNLVSNDTYEWEDVFLWDRISKTTTKISEFPGFEYVGGSERPSVSWDGRFVLFASTSFKKEGWMIPIGHANIYIYDGLTSSLETVCSNYCLDSLYELFYDEILTISLDGSHVAFVAWDGYVPVSGDNNINHDIIVYDRNKKTFQIASRSSSGEIGNDDSYSPAISGDGRYVVFNSKATNFTPLSSKGLNYYIRDMIFEKTALISNELECQTYAYPLGYGVHHSISADGRFVAYEKCYKKPYKGLMDSIMMVIVVKDLKEGMEILVSVPSDK